MLYHDSNIKTGKNTKNNNSGVSLNVWINENISILDMGINIIQQSTSNTVYGIFIFFEIK
jgi:hypothetical protein